MMQKSWWVVVCDAARARVFETTELGARMSEIGDWIEPAGRMSGRELENDRPGRGMDRARGGRHAMDPPTDPHDKVEANFAHTIAEHLTQAHQAGRFGQLALIAAPSMLGRLRSAISKDCAQCCSFDWDRDLTTHTPRDIEAHLMREQAARRERATRERPET
jgi:protein required for attachment to host cells